MMQKILKLYNKLKSSKGATGADIVVALSIIVLTIGVISTIYINLSYMSRKVNRTAGATRIATNIIENIKSLNYEDVNDFLETVSTEYDTESSEEDIENGLTSKTYNNVDNKITITINGKKSVDADGKIFSIFNTKIPKGYNLKLVFTQISDTSIPEKDRKPTFDLIKKIDVTVSFKVRDNTESVSLSSSIERENSKEVNSPDLTSSTLPKKITNIDGDDVKASILPIKYSSIMGTYVPTTESDSEWYNYSNKIWAMVYVDTEDEVNSVKSAGQIDAESLADKIYYWIPRFSTDGKALFGTTNNLIEQLELKSVEDETIKLRVFAKGPDTMDAYDTFNLDGNEYGIWLQKSDTSDETYIAFCDTKFGLPQY
jgi:hypothetical protein